MKNEAKYLKHDLVKSLVLSMLCIAVIVVMYYLEYNH